MNGIQYTVTQNVQFVGAELDDRARATARARPPARSCRCNEIVTWPGMAGTKTGEGGHDARAAGRRVLGVVGLDRGEGLRLDRRGRRRTSTCRWPDRPPRRSRRPSEGCAYFAFLPVGHVHGDGDRGHGRRRPGGRRARADRVGVGRPDRVAAVPRTTPPATITSRGWSPANAARAARRACRSRSRTPACSRTGSSRSAAAPATSTTSPSLFPYASGYTVFAGNCTDNNPLGKDTNRNLFYPTAAPVPLERRRRTARRRRRCRCTRSRCTCRTRPRSPVGGTTPTAAETTTFAVPYTAVCTTGTATRHRADARPGDD